MRRDELRLRLEELYRQYDHRFVTPDPLEFVRAQATDADREVVGLLAAGLAFGTVAQIKRSIAAVLDALGPRPAEAVAGLEARVLATKLRAFRHRWLDGRDVACLLDFARQMRASHGSVEAFFHDGEAVLSAQIFPDAEATGIAWFSENGKSGAEAVCVHRLG